MLLDSAGLLLVGLALAGLIRIVLTEKFAAKFVSGNSSANVFKAALLGVPLPLCSCSVLPVAYQLRESGVSRGATVSFLISTPESGVDSIALTYSLMDPAMTVARPVTAFLTAIAAGLWENQSEADPQSPLPDTPTDNCSDSCGCTEKDSPPSASLASRVLGGLRYAFTDLISDLAPYLLLGYLLAGVVAVIWGGDGGGLPEVLRSGWGAYAGALVIGLPLYICATSSTPLAAALLAAGFSPGAALVFLIVGPATNVASLVVVRRILSGWSFARYLIAVVVVAVLCGLGLDALYSVLGLDSAVAGAGHQHESASPISQFAAVALLGMVLGYSAKRLIARFN